MLLLTVYNQWYRVLICPNPRTKRRLLYIMGVMKVLIIYTNFYRMLPPAPLGASLVASRLRRDGHEVRLLDLMFSKRPSGDAARAAQQFKPDLIGYSLRNVDSQSYTQYYDPSNDLIEVVTAVRANWPATTLLGGTAFTTFPAQYLEVLQADFGIAGDDLDPISHFIDSLAAGRPDHSTPGLVYRDVNEVRCNPFQIRGYADIIFDGWDLIDYQPYRRTFSNLWDAAVVTRSGCPFDCIFCDTFKTFGKRWVLRDPRQVAEELLTVRRRHGIRSVFLADAGFNRPLDHAKAVLEAIIRAKPGVGLTAVFEPGEVDAEFARLYKRAGGRGMMIFAMSLSEPILAAYRRPFHLSDVMEAADLLHRVGVSNFLFLTFGGPGETSGTVEETLSRIPQTRSIYTIFDHGFRIQPETALHEIALAEGAIPPGHSCFKAVFYHSRETPPAMLDARLKRYQAEHRWDSLRGLIPLAHMIWDKLRP